MARSCKKSNAKKRTASLGKFSKVNS